MTQFADADSALPWRKDAGQMGRDGEWRRWRIKSSDQHVFVEHHLRWGIQVYRFDHLSAIDYLVLN